MPAPTAPLATEVATYEAHLHEWAADEGRFVLIAGAEVLGLYDTYQDALTAGYQARALAPFLVKQIATIPQIANFTRHILPVCRTLAA